MMASSVLHEVANQFDDRHVPLHLVLGMIPALKRLRRSFGAPQSERVDGGSTAVSLADRLPPAASFAEQDDPALLLLLGLVGLSQSLMGLLPSAAIRRAGGALSRARSQRPRGEAEAVLHAALR